MDSLDVFILKPWSQVKPGDTVWDGSDIMTVSGGPYDPDDFHQNLRCDYKRWAVNNERWGGTDSHHARPDDQVAVKCGVAEVTFRLTET